jgi:hypothetical protein
MSAALPHLRLWDALVLPLPQAEDAWRRWRASTDLDHLDAASFHLLPALAGRMALWLGDDPMQAILVGICRRAWSQNQIHRKLLTDAIEILRAARIERVAATGPVLWSAVDWPEGAIRPIGRIDLLMEPASVQAAFEAFSRAGWTPLGTLPDTTTNQFYFAPGVTLRSSGGGTLRVHWRALPNTDFALRRPDPPPLRPAPPDHLGPYAIPKEHCLVAALGRQLEDELDWRFDALTICREGSFNWNLVAALLRRRSAARNRLEELRRDWGAPVPPEVTRPSRVSGVEGILVSALRAYRRRKEMRT